MTAATTRRRRLAAVAGSALAAGAFAFGAALGDSPGDGPGAGPSAVSRLPADRLAGQRIVLGFEGAEAPTAVRRMIRRGHAAGVILFADNFPSRVAGRRLLARLQSIPLPPGLRHPLLTMIDQEGGEVKRVGGPPFASAAEMGAAGAVFSRRQGERTAASLRALGINVDLAPVLDVARPGGTIAATGRGFGPGAAAVAATAIPFAEGLREGGVAATAKHFPGLGWASVNTDFAVQRTDLSKRALRAVDEVPFGDFAELGGGRSLVMMSTAIYPAFSPAPAAFAPELVEGELRGRLGYEGVTITDALETAAARAFGGPARTGLAAARAGVDLLLFTDYRSAARAHRTLIRGLRAKALDRARFERSAQRVANLRRELR